MNNQTKKNYLIVLLVFFGLTGKAQNDNFSISTTVGIARPILDNGIGVHFGFNPSDALSSHISIEGQISYLYTKINSTFLSGEEGGNSSFNTLVGSRLYLNSESWRNRLYINLLFGINFNVEELNKVFFMLPPKND